LPAARTCQGPRDNHSALDWETVLVWVAIAAVTAGVIAAGTWWQYRMTRWVARWTSRIDEDRLPPEVKRRVANLRRFPGKR